MPPFANSPSFRAGEKGLIMELLKRGPIAFLARFCMGALFVGTLWLSGCHDDHGWDRDHGDHWDHQLMTTSTIMTMTMIIDES